MAITEHYVTTDGSDTWAASTNPVTPCSLADALTNAAAGDRVNIKSGTYNLTSFSPANAGTAASPIIYRGYSSTIGDGYQGRTNGNGALVVTNMPVFAMSTNQFSYNKAYVIVESINITTAYAGAAVGISGTYNLFSRCVITMTGSSATGYGLHMVGAGNVALDCDVSNTGGTALCAINAGNATVSVLYCRATCTNGIGVRAISAARVIGCVIYDSTTGISYGVAWSTSPIIIGNTIVGNATGILAYSASTTCGPIVNNIITDSSGYGIDGADASGVHMLLAYNRFRANTSGDVRYADNHATATSYGHVTTGASSDFVDAGGNDYRLATGSPARSAGIFAYGDIGALRHIDPSGGGVGFGFSMGGGFNG